MTKQIYIIKDAEDYAKQIESALHEHKFTKAEELLFVSYNDEDLTSEEKDQIEHVYFYAMEAYAPHKLKG